MSFKDKVVFGTLPKVDDAIAGLTAAAGRLDKVVELHQDYVERQLVVVTKAEENIKTSTAEINRAHRVLGKITAAIT